MGTPLNILGTQPEANLKSPFLGSLQKQHFISTKSKKKSTNRAKIEKAMVFYPFT
jgi:hypothetical protein